MQTRTMRRRHAGHRTGLALWQTSFARNMPMRIASRVIPIPWFQSAGIIYTNRTLCHQVRLHIQQSSSRCCSSPYRFVSRTFRRACKIVAIKRASANPRRRDGKTSRTTIQGHNAMCPRRDDFGLAVRPRPIDGGRQTSLPRRSRMNETPGVGSCRRLAFRRERSGLMSEDGGRDFRPSEPLVRILLWLSPRSQAGPSTRIEPASKRPFVSNPDLSNFGHSIWRRLSGSGSVRTTIHQQTRTHCASGQHGRWKERESAPYKRGWKYRRFD